MDINTMIKKIAVLSLFLLASSPLLAQYRSGPGGVNPWRTSGTTTYIDNRQVEIRDGAKFSILYGTSTSCYSDAQQGRIAISTYSSSGAWIYVCEGASGWVQQGGGTISGAASTRWELSGGFVVNTSTVDISSPLVVVDNAGEALLSVDGSSITLQGNTFNQANSLLLLNSSGLIDNSLVDGSSVTKVGATIEETEIVFNTNDGSRHDHVVADLTNVNAGTDLLTDLEEEFHLTEHQDGGGDEINVDDLSGLLADQQKVAISTGGTLVQVSSGINIVAGSNVNISGSYDSTNGRVDVTIESIAPAGAGVYFEEGGSLVVQSSTANFNASQFDITDDSGEASIELSSTTVSLLGSATNQAESVAWVFDDGYIPEFILDNSSVTLLGPTITESEVVFNTNDGSRHDHVAADLSDQHPSTDITTDLEEETHASEHEFGGADAINVFGLSGLLADKQEISVSTGGTEVGVSTGINFIEGTNIQITGTETGNVTDITISAVGAGSGDMILAATQTVTGAKVFNSSITLNNELLDGQGSAGTAGQILTSSGTGIAPEWTTVGGGDITAVTAGDGLLGGGSSGDVELRLGYNSSSFTIVGSSLNLVETYLTSESDPNAILNQETLQSATYHVSSGTVQNNFFFTDSNTQQRLGIFISDLPGGGPQVVNTRIFNRTFEDSNVTGGFNIVASTYSEPQSGLGYAKAQISLTPQSTSLNSRVQLEAINDGAEPSSAGISSSWQIEPTKSEFSIDGSDILSVYTSSMTLEGELHSSSVTVTGQFTDSSLDCTGNSNGGALTTDASGNFVCSDDDGGGALTIGDSISGGAANRILFEDANNTLAEDSELTFSTVTRIVDVPFALQITSNTDADVYFRAANGNATSSAGAALRLEAEAGAYDPRVRFILGGGGSDFTMGIDNSDSDTFKIGVDASEVATNTALEVATDRSVTINTLLNLEGTTCLDVSSDQIYHDTDCDQVKDAGEEFIDLAGGDNLGSHIATQTIDMAGFPITEVSSINYRVGGAIVQGNSGGFLTLVSTASGSSAINRLFYANDSSSITFNNITDGFTISDSSFTFFTADLGEVAVMEWNDNLLRVQKGTFSVVDTLRIEGITSQDCIGTDSSGNVQAGTCSGSGGGDSLGNHTATETLKMAGFEITGVSTMTAQEGRHNVYIASRIALKTTLSSSDPNIYVEDSDPLSSNTGFYIASNQVGLVINGSNDMAATATEIRFNEDIEVGTGNVIRFDADTIAATVNATGEVAIDTTAVSSSMGALIGYDGFQQFYVIGTTNTPQAGYQPRYDTSSGKLRWEEDIKNVILKVSSNTASFSTGDGQACFVVPLSMDGMDLFNVGGHVYTVSSSGTPNFMVRNQTDTADMLSTSITIDANEKDSSTAATAAVINTSTDDVVEGDEICIDVDGAGTGAKGAEIRLGFKTP